MRCGPLTPTQTAGVPAADVPGGSGRRVARAEAAAVDRKGAGPGRARPEPRGVALVLQQADGARPAARVSSARPRCSCAVPPSKDRLEGGPWHVMPRRWVEADTALLERLKRDGATVSGGCMAGFQAGARCSAWTGWARLRHACDCGRRRSAALACVAQTDGAQASCTRRWSWGWWSRTCARWCCRRWRPTAARCAPRCAPSCPRSLGISPRAATSSLWRCLTG